MRKRLGIFISLVITAVISIGIIIMVLVQVNYKPIINDPYAINVYESESEYFTLTKAGNESSFNEVMSEYENSFARSFLSAFFAGQVSGNTLITQISDEDFDDLLFTGYKIEFSYSSAQTLQANGQDLLKTYNKIIFEVNNYSTYNELTIYFEQTTSDNYYVLTTYAIQNSFYDYLVTLFE